MTPLDDFRVADGRLVGFKRHFRVEVREGVGAFLFSEQGVTALRGGHIDAVAALLDGTRDIPTLLREAPDEMDVEQVAELIGRLVDAGLVTFRDPANLDADERTLAYWDACGLPARQLTTAQVGVIAVGAQSAGTLQALAAAGITAVAAAGPAPVGELTVVVCDDYLNGMLAEIDAAHRAAGVPWLLAKPDGIKIWVGPVFAPGETGCWHCLATRLWQHRQAERVAQADLGRSGPALRPGVSLPALGSTANQLIALEATKWLAGHRYPGQRAVWTLDSQDLQGSHHELRRRPQCSACGDPAIVAARARRPIALEPSPKVSGTGGGHRSLRPEEMLLRYDHLISPITGVVKEIVRDDRGPSMLNSFRSGPNLAAAARGLGSLRRGLRDHSGGKGVSAVEAQVGALCEAIERYSSTFQGDEQMVTASLRTLGEDAVDPRECLLFDERQFTGRDEWNRRHGAFQHVFDPFDPERVLPWSPLWSLTEQRHRYLPTAMLYGGTPRELSAGLVADSNGNAAGSSLVDAVLQGALELVERDAVALWWYNRTSAPEVDVASFADPWTAELRKVYAGLGREVWVLDVTSDLGIPAMVAVSRKVGGGREDILFGCGAHLDPAIALRRALTELNQLLPSVLHGASVNLTDPDATWWWHNATVANQPYLLPDRRQGCRRPGSYGYRHSDDIRADVYDVRARLAKRGLDLLVLDQTRPDLGLPVVKVVVPGLRHFWARFGPGRLFDVPVELGRRDKPLGYDDINPVPFFL